VRFDNDVCISDIGANADRMAAMGRRRLHALRELLSGNFTPS
jgi:hypothetical protein